VVNILTSKETVLDFQEEICSMEPVCWLVENEDYLRRGRKAHTYITRLQKWNSSDKLNIFWCLFKFTDKEGNWREDIQRVEEDIVKFAVRYSVQEDEWQRGGVGGGGQGGGWLGPGRGRKEYGVKWNEKIIIFCGLRKWEPRDHVALWHTQTNQMNVTDKQRNCTVHCECSTDSSKLLYTTHIS